MRILIVPHIGETLGHVVMGLAIADELSRRGADVEIAAARRGFDLISGWSQRYVFHPIRWDWSHNSCDAAGESESFYARVCLSVQDVADVVRHRRPDLLVGLPGFATTQVARHYHVPHASILHGPHLSPIVSLDNPDSSERAILKLGDRFCKTYMAKGFEIVSERFGFSGLDYDEYLDSETIFVPQPGLKLKAPAGLREVPFIGGSFGPVRRESELLPHGTCYVTFGTGNPCDISRVVELAAEVFPTVLVTVGNHRLRPMPSNVIVNDFVAISSLAGGPAAVINHGGIGVVGVFANSGTPQLIIPTELDQATMAVHARRLGIADACGLRVWETRFVLGRRMPQLDDEEILVALRALAARGTTNRFPSCNGASEIADQILSQGTTSRPHELGHAAQRQPVGVQEAF